MSRGLELGWRRLILEKPGLGLLKSTGGRMRDRFVKMGPGGVNGPSLAMLSAVTPRCPSPVPLDIVVEVASYSKPRELKILCTLAKGVVAACQRRLFHTFWV